VKTKSTYVKDIQPGEKISELFLVTQKNLAFSQRGIPYLNLRLRDRTGEIDGKIWEKATDWNDVFKKGDIIHAQCRAARYRDALQLSVMHLEKVDDGEIDPADFFPTVAGDIGGMFTQLTAFMETVKEPHFKALLTAFFEDVSIVSLFKKAPAAKGFHHVAVGGLLEHTLSVTKLLNEVEKHYTGVNRDLLITGGILHDIGKIREFTYERLIDYSDEGRLIGHIVISVEMVDGKIAEIADFPEQAAMELRHVILSHHGLLEYGSPKRPKTLEALMVHYVDDLDAKVNAFQEYIKGSTDEESDWTPFHRLFDRFIYKGK
jgi:3'-5' exoribonuclease